jgi:hypothetical protein
VVEGSLSVNVIVAVSPMRSAVVLLEIATVGATVSIESDGVSWLATLAFPAGSVNVVAATETVPAEVEFAVGVNVAV